MHLQEPQPENLAALATVSGPGQYPEGAVDGIRQIEGAGEWIGESPNTWYGWITFPHFELKWEEAQTINTVVLYDRATLGEQLAACVLKFSDGSEEHVFALPNDGSPKRVVFTPRTVTGFKVEALDGVGTRIGLSEIEVYHDPAAQAETKPEKVFTDYVSYVNPMIETGRGRWFFCTPGSRPFGVVSAAAYTRNKNQGGGGYNYNSTEILGFANIHAWIQSGINLMPVTGAVNANGGEKEWKSTFSHTGEIMEPGYHKVFLDRYRTQVEYTSTERVAFYRLKYEAAAEAKLLLQLGGFVGAASYVDGKARWVAPNRVEGSHGMTDRLWGGPKLSHVFYVMEFDRPIKRMDGWKGADTVLTGIEDFENPIPEGRIQPGYFQKVEKYLFKNLPEEQAGVGMAYTVEAGDTVQVKIGISYTSVENARKNLEAECPHWDFDRVRSESRAEWNHWLGKIEVQGGAVETRVKFYTDLWHVLLGRHRINDRNGEYPSYMSGANPFVSMIVARGHPGFKAPEEMALENGVVPLVIERVPLDTAGKPLCNMYNSDATWLTQWNLNTLWGLAWPEILDDFSASMLQYAKVGGHLPRGPSGGGYTAIMRGCPTTSLITATWQKGLLRKADAQTAYRVMRESHPLLIRDAGAGEMVQGAFEYWALAQMAEELGHRADLADYEPWIHGWKKYFDPEKNLLSGRWVEANDWQGTFGVSHDIPGLAKLMGGPEVLAKQLDYAFEQGVDSDFVYTYNEGTVSYANQPGLSNAHVFNYVGQPWLSQKWVRAVSREAYGGTNPNIGYGGHDEDQGQMGGVSALMKIGLFSLRGTSSKDPVYEITTPEFDSVTIHLDPRYYPGKSFRIITHNNTPENLYIQSAQLNGKALHDCWFYHRDFAKGGTLELVLGPEPNPSWGRRPPPQVTTRVPAIAPQP
jgi:putative alpha-1,2-mannosidase